MSSDTSTTLATLRGIVQSTGYSYRVLDEDLRRIAESANPRSVCEDIVRRLGGRPQDFSNLIDRMVAAAEAPRQGPPQDAPATESLDKTEIADRLRTFAASQNLPAEMVEEGLVYAGLVEPEPEPEDEDEEETIPTSQDEVNAAILATLRQMNKRLKKMHKAL